MLESLQKRVPVASSNARASAELTSSGGYPAGEIWDLRVIANSLQRNNSCIDGMDHR
jgi:hypothetical protein